ncbi:alpha/beta fold hydrolase [uncultured Enterovirga sp.]|uniref:alpha/beta fold hydrolase n=1 Tax=uncultured Enterovirga sp. TaxID=2026352 RepID=UPI0035CA7EEA
MQLLETASNPIPSGAEVTVVRTRDGVSLRVASWAAPAGPDRGTVIILQGRAEFIEKYFEVVGELRARGFAVVAFDWRGQGGSDRALPDRHRGHVRHFEDFRLDFEAVRQSCAPGAAAGPVYGLAHSMGGCIALIGAQEGWLAVDRLVATSPMIRLSLVRRPRLARALARILAGIGFGTLFVPGGPARSISTLPFEGNRLCTDRGRYERNALVATALGWCAIGAPTVGWYLAANEAMDRISAPGVAASIQMPVLVVAGGDDPICSTPAIERFARELPNGTLVTVLGSRHESLMETDSLRAAFWRAFDAFMVDGTATATADDHPRRMSSTVA